MLLVWTSLMVQLVRIYALQSNSCGFNSMCTCSPDQHDTTSRSIHSISCLSVPFYKFPNPRVTHFPLMNAPLTVVTVSVFYLLFVLKYGPNFMKNRKPYNLKKIIIGYNVTQIIFNIFGLVWTSFYIPDVSIFCTPLDKPNLATLHYWYFVLKTIDLIETIFFVLRKNFKQISFLHVYHHTGMFVGSWATCKYIPGGQVFFLGYINLFVHAVMYVYYLLTSWDSTYKKSIWWKRHLTELQIVQHCLILISFLLLAFNQNCNYPKTFLIGILPLMFLMIYLFVDFYKKAYIQKKLPNKVD